jgi:hypothetical protein
MDQYIYSNKHSLSCEICTHLIKLFEEEDTKYRGVTFGGLDENVKDTMDYRIPMNTVNDKWSRVVKLLNIELSHNIKTYVSEINKSIDIIEEASTNKYQVFHNKQVTYDTFLLQRYTKNKGRYIYHEDAQIDWKESKYRILTYIWYLNTVHEGGETEFWAKYKINPEAGKLVIFPATWTYPHRGKMPVSNDKYILTGWIYLKEDQSV